MMSPLGIWLICHILYSCKYFISKLFLKVYLLLHIHFSKALIVSHIWILEFHHMVFPAWLANNILIRSLNYFHFKKQLELWWWHNCTEWSFQKLVCFILRVFSKWKYWVKMYEKFYSSLCISSYCFGKFELYHSAKKKSLRVLVLLVYWNYFHPQK